MRAEVLTIGDEICRGEIVDTNAAWLASELWQRDVVVHWMTSCRDYGQDLRAALSAAGDRVEVVVTTGGLGPTEDDLTVDVVSEVLGVEPAIHAPSLDKMKQRYERVGFTLTPNNLRQVRAPAGATVYENPVGAAPGFEVGLGGARCFCLPGVPRELKAIAESSVFPRIVELREADGSVERIARRILRVFGQGESHIATALEGVTEGVRGASIHYQVKFPETLVKLVVRDPEAAAAAERLGEIDNRVRAAIGNKVYGTDDDSLASVLGRALGDRSLTLATAESCTGGLIGELITAVPGSSDYFLGGAITYTNPEKQRQLGVSAATLDVHGAVSEACVDEMARGARERFGVDIAVATSGIAGPAGGTEANPVGTVWVACVGPGQRIRCRRYLWPASRDGVRRLAAYWAMSMALAAAAGGDDEGGVHGR